MCDFLSVIKYKAFGISQGVFSVPIWKIDSFYPILQYCQFLRNTVPRAVGESNGDFFFNFYGENRIGFNNFFFKFGLNKSLRGKIFRKISKKNQILLFFSNFRKQYFLNQWDDLQNLFCKSFTILLSLRICY